MNQTYCSKIIVSLLAGIFLGVSALAAEPNEIQGKWKAQKEINGEKVTFHFQINQDKFNFKLQGADGSTRMVAQGKVATDKLGPFKTLALRDMRAGESESDLQAVDDTRVYVYTTGWKTLTVAGNFDRDRNNEEANLTVYEKIQD